MTLVIKIADVYSTTPYCRFKARGNCSGEEFANLFIKPVLHEFGKIIIDMDDLYGLPLSFRRGAFYDLLEEYSSKFLLDRLEFRCTDDPNMCTRIVNDMRVNSYIS